MADFIADDTKARQRSALLAALLQGPLSSIAARDRLGMVHPAGRIMELRRRGYAIKTLRTTAKDSAGRTHTCALYVLEAADD